MVRAEDRAAVHRRAEERRSRREQAPTNGADRVRAGAEGVAEGIRSHPKALLVIVALVVVVFALFGPVRDYYVAMRSGQDLQAYYDALAAQNEELGEDISRLQTREGVEDEARKHGLVSEGETGVVVEGIGDSVSAPLPAVEMEDTRPWYTKALDGFFGYEYGSWQ